MRLLAYLWLIITLIAGGYLLLRLHEGLNFHSDLMALLPQEERDPNLQHVNDTVVRDLSRRVIILVGHKDREEARAAAKEIVKTFSDSDVLDIVSGSFDKDQMKQIGKLYYPYRDGLLAEADRQLLREGKAAEIPEHAKAEVYGMAGFANADLLKNDPFLLMPHFFMGLPIPLSRLSLDEGLLSLKDQGTTWVMIAGRLKGEPFALNVEENVSGIFDRAVAAQKSSHPGLEVLHLGAVFFANAGAKEAMSETTIISILSIIGTVLLVIGMFRTLRPLFLSLLVIGVGVMVALSASLWIFGELHVGALLFGVSLIGVAVDYSLQYCAEVFAPDSSAPKKRLKRVVMGITIGAATTIIGYLTLLLAPFPGLHQIAAFSAVGLLASWITVVLWLPLLDTMPSVKHGQSLLRWAGAFLSFWEEAPYRNARIIFLSVISIIGLIGFFFIHLDDNVRHLEALSGSLVSEQAQIEKLIGNTEGGQFFLVHAADEETALQHEEQLIDILHPLVVSGALGGFEALAEYVPSSARQKENRLLSRKYLYEPFLASQKAELNLTEAPLMPKEEGPTLKVAELLKSGVSFPFLSMLRLSDETEGVSHVVMLSGRTDLTILKDATRGIEGVRLVDPAGDFSDLLAKYRERAIALLALSALLMAPLLVWRYGFRKGLWIMFPPSLAVLLAPAIRGILGGSFTFFDAMALVLILSIGVDYAVFCAETSGDRKRVTVLAVAMAAGTALMSFGLLDLSRVTAVHNFGATMLIGILLAFLFAPMARLEKKTKALPVRNILPVFLALLFCSCSYGGEDMLVSETPSVISIAKDVPMSLPSPGSLGRKINASQLVTAHFVGQTLAFEGHIEATPEHFLFAGLDLMGRKAININWSKNNITYEAASFVPKELEPQNILVDMVLLYWPEPIVRQLLEPFNGKLIVTPNRRIILIGDKEIMRAEYYPDKDEDVWSGRIHYKNLAYGYELDIKSMEQKP